MNISFGKINCLLLTALCIPAVVGCVRGAIADSSPLADLSSPQADSSHFADLSSSESSSSASFVEEVLAAHNRYRQEVDVASLQWSSDIAASAQSWADELASRDAFTHSSSSYGENLWKGTADSYSLTQMVESWGNEQQYFIADAAFPEVSTTGNWGDVGHYTQMIWEDTTEVGCAIATGHGWDVLVCQYNPPGNVIGQRPF